MHLRFCPQCQQKKNKKNWQYVGNQCCLLLLSRVLSLSHSLRTAENTKGLYKVSRKRAGAGGEGRGQGRPAGTATMDSSGVLNVKTNHLSVSNRSVLFVFFLRGLFKLDNVSQAREGVSNVFSNHENQSRIGRECGQRDETMTSPS